jgi:hypothetical protein
LSKNDNNPLLTGWIPKANQSHSKVPNDSEHGVDWVNLRIDLDPSCIDLTSPLWTVDRNGSSPDPDIAYSCYYAQIPFGNTQVDATLNIDRMRVYLRFNPSTALYGKTKNILPAPALQPLVEKLLAECFQHFSPLFDHVDERGTISRDPRWADLVWISRLDAARNLQILDAFRFKKAIEAAMPRNKKTKFIYASGAKGWGVVNMTKTAGQDRIYDKDVELSLHDADEILAQNTGTCFRFETQLQGDRLDKFNLRRLSDVTAESVWRVIEERWMDCRWDVTFAEPGTIATAIAHLSPSEKTGLLGYLGMHQLGFANEITTSGHRKYGAIARALGLVPGQPLEDQGAAAQYADIHAGTVVELKDCL